MRLTLQQVIALVLACQTMLAAEDQRPRRPVALALVDNDSHLLVANQRSGTLSTVDLNRRKVVSETRLAGSLSALIVGRKRPIAVALDDVGNRLIVGTLAGHQLRIDGEVAVSRSPVSVLLSADERRAFVASLWSHRVSILDVESPAFPRVTAVIELPFAPRLQILLPDERHLVVAAAFGGELGLLDTETARLLQMHRLDGHNLRGMGVSKDRKTLYVSHQILNDYPATTRGGVHWGGVLENVIRAVEIAALHSPQRTPRPAGDLYYLGHPDRAAGDPTSLMVSRNGRQILAFAGVAELAISDPGVNFFQRVPVGRRPTALILRSDDRVVYVANTMDDSLSIVPIDSPRHVTEIELGPARRVGLAEQGERLFYDATLSSDGWFSCHSCHPDGHTNGALSDNFGDGSVGAPKRVLSLLGVAATGPWSWDGTITRLEEQVRKSILTTMRGEDPTDRQVEALTAYLRTLAPAPSLSAARRQPAGPAVARGADLFRRLGCVDCHQPGRFTSPDVYDVGLQDRLGNRRFNPPSLRGVSQRGALFHDNRAASIKDVLVQHRHGVEEELPARLVEDLVAYLNSL
ncbi:MAG: hypothetical protein CMJ59_05330 [Planctomycetaceae bacterium]|nr:hypothetical protein [Planctomycetaceae bacterium]